MTEQNGETNLSASASARRFYPAELKHRAWWTDWVLAYPYDGEKVSWDDVRDPATGEIHPVAAGALEPVDAYAEIPQSSKGVHQFVFGEIPGSLRRLSVILTTSRSSAATAHRSRCTSPAVSVR